MQVTWTQKVFNLILMCKMALLVCIDVTILQPRVRTATEYMQNFVLVLFCVSQIKLIFLAYSVSM